MKKFTLLVAILLALVGSAQAQSWNRLDYTSAGATFANLSLLPVPQMDGPDVYSSGCSQTTTCTGGGGCACAIRLAGVWSCSSATSRVVGLTNPLLNDLNANSHKVTGLGAATNTGDAVGFRQAAVQLQSLTGTGVNGLQVTGSRPDGSHSISKMTVNGVFNVKAYGAVGNGSRDDTTAIQNAVYATCGATPPALPTNVLHGSLFFPPTPNACYFHTQPIRFTCGSAEYFGQGGHENGSTLCQNYWGPAVILAGYQEDTLNLTGPALVTGTTQSLATSGCSGKSCGYVLLNEVANQRKLNGLAGFTVEGFLEFTSMGAGDNNTNLLYAFKGLPSTTHGVEGAFLVGLDGSNHLFVKLRAGGTQYSVTSTQGPATNTVLHIAAVLDPNAGNSTVRLFYNGTQIGSTATGGANTLTVDPFESIELVGAGAGTTGCLAIWPDAQPVCSAEPGNLYIGPVRLSQVARYTSNFTPPTADFVSDINNIITVDWPTSPDMTTKANTGFCCGSGAVYLPIHGGSGTQQIPSVKMHDLEFCGIGSIGTGLVNSDGLFAVWSFNSIFDNLSCQAADFVGLNFNNNDFDSTVTNSRVGGGNGNWADIGIEYGSAANENLYSNNIIDNAVVGFLYEPSGGFLDIKPTITDRGAYIYPFVTVQNQFTLLWPFEDEEAANTVKLASVYASGNFANSDIINGQLNTRNAAPYLTISGSGTYPVKLTDTVLGTFGAVAGAAQAVHILTSPVSPVVLEDPTFGNPLPTVLTDSPKDVVLKQGSSSSQAPFDNGTVTSNTNLSNLSAYPIQKATTGANSVTYRLQTTVNVGLDALPVGQIVELNLVVGKPGAWTGTTVATATGAIKWAGGNAPSWSTTTGYTDVVRLKWDGTNWQEVSRSIGNH